MLRLRRPVAALLLALVISGAIASVVVWRQGYGIYAVRTGSMSPTIPVGAAVIDVAPGRSIAPGDVITFGSPTGEQLTTHRVVRVQGNLVATKGDANAVVDVAPVARDQVRGRVIASIAGAG